MPPLKLKRLNQSFVDKLRRRPPPSSPSEQLPSPPPKIISSLCSLVSLQTAAADSDNEIWGSSFLPFFISLICQPIRKNGGENSIKIHHRHPRQEFCWRPSINDVRRKTLDPSRLLPTFHIGLRKMAPARASLRLPGTGERERRGNTEPFEGLFSRPDTMHQHSVC